MTKIISMDKVREQAFLEGIKNLNDSGKLVMMEFLEAFEKEGKIVLTVTYYERFLLRLALDNLQKDLDFFGIDTEPVKELQEKLKDKGDNDNGEKTEI